MADKPEPTPGVTQGTGNQHVQFDPNSQYYPSDTLASLQEDRTYYINIPIRPLTSQVPEEHLQRLSLYFTIYGVVFMVVGVVAILFPFLFAIAIEQLLAWLLVLGGGVTLLNFLLVCGAPGTTAFLLLGALHLGVGLWMLLQPIAGGTMLIFILAGWFLAHGVLKLLMACQLRSLASWPAVLVSGLISVVLAFTILAFAPVYGVKLIGILFGADLLSSGLSLLLIALMAYLGHRARDTPVPTHREALLPGGTHAAAASA